MELENQAARQTYIELLTEISKKKIDVLTVLKKLTERQESVITAQEFNEDEFLELVSLKEEQLKALSELDDGFEQLYDSVREELTANRNAYASQINELKEQITAITDLSVNLQTLEKRNKARLETALSSKRRKIKSAQISVRTATSYYKAMTQQLENQSFFYDKKK